MIKRDYMKNILLSFLFALTALSLYAQDISAYANVTEKSIQRQYWNNISLGKPLSLHMLKEAFVKTSENAIDVKTIDDSNEYRTILVKFDDRIWSEVYVMTVDDVMKQLTLRRKSTEQNTDFFNEMSKELTERYGQAQIHKTDTGSGFYQSWSDERTCLTLSYEYLYTEDTDSWAYFVAMTFDNMDKNNSR